MEKQSTRLSVSIVLYHNSVALLYETLKSLFDSSSEAVRQGEVSEVQVNVIDNSQSTSYKLQVCHMLERMDCANFFSVRYQQAGSNSGFGGGHNLAQKNMGSDYHLVLNPDVELEAKALSAGLSALRRDGTLVLLSPRVNGTTGEQEYLCKSYPSVLVLLLRAFAPNFIRKLFRSRMDRYEMREVCSADNVEDVLLASGCFMLMRTAAFLQVGGFNERYFLYFEDFDFSVRIRELGRVVFFPAIKITHHGGYAASKGHRHIRLFIQSGYRFFSDHGWKWI